MHTDGVKVILFSSLVLGIVSAASVDLANATSSIGNFTSSDLKPFIVGGVEAEKNEFPWLVHLSIRTSEGTFLCGGALIQMNQVLTAAHCVNEAISVSVTAGDHDRTRIEDTEQTLPSKHIRYHEDYNDGGLTGRLFHDIAIIELEKGFTRTAAVGPIALPAPDAVISQSSVYTKVSAYVYWINGTEPPSKSTSSTGNYSLHYCVLMLISIVVKFF